MGELGSDSFVLLSTLAAAPAAAVAAPAVVAPAAPVLREVTFTSTPAGASVVLVDGGTPRPLGPTPITASIDPTKSYDVMFALDGYPTTMQRLSPGGGTMLSAVLGARRRAAAIEVHVATDEHAGHRRHHADGEQAAERTRALDALRADFALVPAHRRRRDRRRDLVDPRHHHRLLEPVFTGDEVHRGRHVRCRLVRRRLRPLRARQRRGRKAGEGLRR